MRTFNLIAACLPQLLLTSCLSSTENASRQLDCGDLCNGLVAYFRLDGNAIDATRQFSGRIYGNPTPTANRFDIPNSAIYFGSENYISIPKMGLSGDISVCGWFKIRGEHHPNHMVFFGQAIEYSNRWQLIGSRSEVTYYDRKGDDNAPYAVNIQQSLNQWYSLCAVSSPDFDANKKVKLYLNGEWIGDVSSRHITEIDADYNIGRFYNESGWDFCDGSMDDVAIYNRQLSPQEILTFHETGIPL